jgi:hypothetical protein
MKNSNLTPMFIVVMYSIGLIEEIIIIRNFLIFFQKSINFFIQKISIIYILFCKITKNKF